MDTESDEEEWYFKFIEVERLKRKVKKTKQHHAYPRMKCAYDVLGSQQQKSSEFMSSTESSTFSVSSSQTMSHCNKSNDIETKEPKSKKRRKVVEGVMADKSSSSSKEMTHFDCLVKTSINNDSVQMCQPDVTKLTSQMGKGKSNKISRKVERNPSSKGSCASAKHSRVNHEEKPNLASSKGKQSTSKRKSKTDQMKIQPVRKVHDGHCPYCQIPFEVLIIESPKWHTMECMDLPIIATAECPDGLKCDSTLPSHYRRFRHTRLAQLRAGVTTDTSNDGTNYKLPMSENFPKLPTSAPCQVLKETADVIDRFLPTQYLLPSGCGNVTLNFDKKTINISCTPSSRSKSAEKSHVNSFHKSQRNSKSKRNIAKQFCDSQKSEANQHSKSTADSSVTSDGCTQQRALLKNDDRGCSKINFASGDKHRLIKSMTSDGVSSTSLNRWNETIDFDGEELQDPMRLLLEESDSDEDSVYNDGDPKHNDGDPKHNDADTMDSDGDTMDNDADPKDNDGDTMDNYGDTMDNDADPKDNDADTMDNDADTMDNDGDTMDNDADPKHNDADTMDNDGDTIDNYADPKHNYGDPIDNDGDPIDNDGDPMDNDGDPMDNDDDSVSDDDEKPSCIQPRSTVFLKRPDSIVTQILSSSNVDDVLGDFNVNLDFADIETPEMLEDGSYKVKERLSDKFVFPTSSTKDKKFVAEDDIPGNNNSKTLRRKKRRRSVDISDPASESSTQTSIVSFFNQNAGSIFKKVLSGTEMTSHRSCRPSSAGKQLKSVATSRSSGTTCAASSASAHRISSSHSTNVSDFSYERKTKPTGSAADISATISSAQNPPEETRGRKFNCPFYKKIPDTSITVDGFRYGNIPGCKAYVLTHFHYDHYGGLTKHFNQPLYCSKITGNLVKAKIRVDERYIHTLPMNQPCVVEGVQLTLMEANHCPGAVILLFRLRNGKTFLHTGDFRANSEMEEYSPLVGTRIDQLYLDTTYCDPTYVFPSQKEVITFAINLVQKALEQNSRTLVVCGTYTIGKEKIFLAIAEAIDSKIGVARDKKLILDCLDDERLDERTTLQLDDCRVHVLPMGKLKAQSLASHLSLYKNFSQILALEPTGWTHSNKIISLNQIRPKYCKAGITIYGIPYSEHSSYNEMKRFTQFMRPGKILPTVNNGNPQSRKKMEAHFKSWMDELDNPTPVNTIAQSSINKFF